MNIKTILRSGLVFKDVDVPLLPIHLVDSPKMELPNNLRNTHQLPNPPSGNKITEGVWKHPGNIKMRKKKVHIFHTYRPCIKRSTDSSSPKQRTNLFTKFKSLLFKWLRVRILSRMVVQRKNLTFEGIPKLQMPLH